jgi:UDP-N-acetylglucosamine 4-epimerase
LITNEVNVTGTLNIFTAAKEQGIRRVVYAASSSTYGDHPGLPKVEEKIGNPLSPYAVSKLVNELYAKVYADIYGMELIGLRYFNIFGPRQRTDGAYAAVIPLFVNAVLNNEPPVVNGNGEHSRDFTYVANAVQANERALFTRDKEAVNQLYNIACGEQTTLNDLFLFLKGLAGSDLVPLYGPERPGDVKHSLADISKANTLLNYQPSVTIREGLKSTFEWYRKHHHFSYT